MEMRGVEEDTEGVVEDGCGELCCCEGVGGEGEG